MTNRTAIASLLALSLTTLFGAQISMAASTTHTEHQPSTEKSSAVLTFYLDIQQALADDSLAGAKQAATKVAPSH